MNPNIDKFIIQMIAAFLHVYLQHMNQKEFLPLHSFQYTDGKN